MGDFPSTLADFGLSPFSSEHQSLHSKKPMQTTAKSSLFQHGAIGHLNFLGTIQQQRPRFHNWYVRTRLFHH